MPRESGCFNDVRHAISNGLVRSISVWQAKYPRIADRSSPILDISGMISAISPITDGIAKLGHFGMHRRTRVARGPYAQVRPSLGGKRGEIEQASVQSGKDDRTGMAGNVPASRTRRAAVAYAVPAALLLIRSAEDLACRRGPDDDRGLRAVRDGRRHAPRQANACPLSWARKTASRNRRCAWDLMPPPSARTTALADSAAKTPKEKPRKSEDSRGLFRHFWRRT